MSDQKLTAVKRAIRREIRDTRKLVESVETEAIVVGLSYRLTALRDALTIMAQVEDRLSRQPRTPRKAGK